LTRQQRSWVAGRNVEFTELPKKQRLTHEIAAKRLDIFNTCEQKPATELTSAGVTATIKCSRSDTCIRAEKTGYSPQKTTAALQNPDRQSLTEASNKPKKILLERKLIVRIK
jgi:hypothetical protein